MFTDEKKANSQHRFSHAATLWCPKVSKIPNSNIYNSSRTSKTARLQFIAILNINTQKNDQQKYKHNKSNR